MKHTPMFARRLSTLLAIVMTLGSVPMAYAEEVPSNEPIAPQESIFLSMMEGETTTPATETAKLTLQTAIDHATPMLDLHIVSADGTDVDPLDTWVTQETKDAFQSEITNATTVFEDVDAGQVLVEDTTTSLNNAATAYEAAGLPGTLGLPTSAELEALTTLIEEAKILQSTTVVSVAGTDVATTEYWVEDFVMADLATWIGVAEEIAIDPASTQEDVTGVTASLTDSVEEFTTARAPGSNEVTPLETAKASLTFLINEINTVEKVAVSVDGTDIAPEDYWTTQADLDTLEAAVAVAQAELDNPEATVESITAQRDALDLALMAYVDAAQSGLYAEMPIAGFAINWDTVMTEAVAGIPYEANGTIKLQFGDNTFKDIAITDAMLSGHEGIALAEDSTSVTLTVTYGGYTATYSVAAQTKSYMMEDVLPNEDVKTVYTVGEPFEQTGNLTVNYRNGQKELVPFSDAIPPMTAPSTDYEGTTTAYFMLNGKYIGITYTVLNDPNQVYVTDVEWDPANPVKTEYIEGQSFIPQGNVIVVYSDGTKVVEEVQAYHGSYTPTQTVGNGINATMQVHGHLLHYPINVIPRIPTGVEITTGAPLRVVYVQDSEFSLTDSKITVTFNDESTELISLTPDMVTGFDSSVLGTNTLTVTYEGLTCTYDVEIIEQPAEIVPVSITPVLDGLKTKYYVGDTFAATQVVVANNDGSTTHEYIFAGQVEGFDTSAVTTGQVVTLKFNDTISTTITIDVVADSVKQLVQPPVPFKMVAGELLEDKEFSVQAIYESGKVRYIPLTDLVNVDTTIASNSTLYVYKDGQFTPVQLIVARKFADKAVYDIDTKDIPYVNSSTTLDTLPLILRVRYMDGTSELVNISALDITSGNLESTATPGIKGYYCHTDLTDNRIDGYVVSTNDPSLYGTNAELTITDITAPTEYRMFENPSEDITLTATDGTFTKTFSVIDPMVYHIDFDTSAPGNYTSSFAIGEGPEFQYNYTVLPLEESGLEDATLTWASEPVTTFEKGNPFLPKANLLLTRTDGSEAYFTMVECEVTGFDSSVVGPQTVTISIAGLSVKLNITIVDKDVTPEEPKASMTVTGLTTEYKVGAAFDNKGTVTVTNEDGKTTLLTVKDCTVKGFDSSKEGSIEVTIAYGELTHKYTVTIVKAPVVTPPSGGGGGGGGGGSVTPKPPVVAPTVPTAPEATKPSKVTTITKEDLKTVTAFTLPAQALQGMDLTNLTVADGKAAQAISVAGKTIDFKDIKGHWAADAIDSAVKKGLLNGVSGTDFAPKAPLTLEQALVGINNAMMLNNMISMKMDRADVEKAMATQLANPTWSTFAVAQTLANTDKATLDKVAANPAALKANITRAELAEMLFKVLGTTLTVDAANAEDFCKATGFMVGDANGNFSGDRALSRAELSSVLLRVDAKLAAI